MDPFDNPFRPGAGTRPPALLGRDTLIDEFALALRRTNSGRPGKSLMPVGLRGVGKTVLLNRFQEIAEAEGVKVGFIEAGEGGEFVQLLAVRLRTILLALTSGPASRAVQRALGVLRSFAYMLPDGGNIRIDVDPVAGVGDSGIVSEDLTDLLLAVGAAAADRSTSLLLSIDEVQYLEPADFSAVIAAIHRCNQRNLPVLLIGAGLPQLPAIAGTAKSYAERLFDFPTIGPLEPDDAAAALLEPARENGVDIDPDALEALLARSQGYPYFLQEWGYRTWNVAATSPITASDVDAASTDVVRHLDDNFFRVRFDRLTPAEREYLVAMAQLGAGPHRSGDIAACLGVKVESVGPRRGNLIRKGMIYSPAHGDTAFTVPLFDEFLLRTTRQARQ